MISSAQEQTYLFVDAVHLTTAGQQIESDYEYSLVTAPGQISLLVESIAQVGLARAATIQRRIDFPGQQRQPNRVATWVDAGAGSLNLKNAPGFPEESSTPFGSTAGVDYQTPGGVIVGAALSAGDQRLRFSTGGHCTQVDEAPSLYVAYQTGPVWGNAIATYELIQDHIARQVPLGTFTDQNNADTRGQSVALALRGGEDFSLGRITTGPVAGVVWQQTHLNGFTETGTSGATALSFGSQTRDLLVSQLGWRGSTSVGRWQLLAEVEWNHDWAGKNREVTASLTSVAAAPYTTAAAPVAEDWATASLGTAYELNSRTTLQAAVSAMIGNSRAASYGGDLSLSIGF
jgi:outer membrane lipase/esterase